MINGLDLFSGIGGLSLALKEWVRPIAYCESDRYCQGVLLSRMRSGDLAPAPICDDVRALSGRMLRDARPEIIYGGFPCQDISIAGTGKGLDGERSRLFFEVIRLCGEIRPRFVFLENVPAITYRGLERILLEFTALGYNCRWTIVSAGEFGAPHLRERWWLCAHANGARLSEPRCESNEKSKPRGAPRDTSVLLVQSDLWKKSPSDIHRMDDGLSPKTHRIRALGNAVVPIQAREAFMRLMGLK